jgi:hypothetical protein
MPSTVDEPISGNLYPTLSGKPGSNVVSNPPFHPSILNVGGGNSATNPRLNNGFGYNSGGNLQRGKLVGGAGAYYGVPTNVSYIVNFLYNPATIYESRAIDMNSGILPASARNQSDTGQYATGLSTTISFALLFDRTFELWDSSYTGTIAGTYGARADIESLYNLVGINTSVAATQSVVNPQQGSNGTQKTNVTIQGPMIVSPCNLYFGANSPGALSFYGFISGMDITWSHFSAAMVPVRAEVDVTFTVLPTSSNNYNIAG